MSIHWITSHLTNLTLGLLTLSKLMWCCYLGLEEIDISRIGYSLWSDAKRIVNANKHAILLRICTYLLCSQDEKFRPVPNESVRCPRTEGIQIRDDQSTDQCFHIVNNILLRPKQSVSTINDTRFLYFSAEDELKYCKFCDDFGPVNLAAVYRFCKKASIFNSKVMRQTLSSWIPLKILFQ